MDQRGRDEHTAVMVSIAGRSARLARQQRSIYQTFLSPSESMYLCRTGESAPPISAVPLRCLGLARWALPFANIRALPEQLSVKQPHECLQDERHVKEERVASDVVFGQLDLIR